jgi:hypothetical protein
MAMENVALRVLEGADEVWPKHARMPLRERVCSELTRRQKRASEKYLAHWAHWKKTSENTSDFPECPSGPHVPLAGRVLFKYLRRGLGRDEPFETSAGHKEAAIPDVHPTQAEQQCDAAWVQEIAIDNDIIAKEQLIVSETDASQRQIAGDRGNHLRCGIKPFDILAVVQHRRDLDRELGMEAIEGATVCFVRTFATRIEQIGVLRLSDTFDHATESSPVAAQNKRLVRRWISKNGCHYFAPPKRVGVQRNSTQTRRDELHPWRNAFEMGNARACDLFGN